MNLADKVSIDIPGVGLVEAFNAAQESTLREILAAIEKSGDDGGGGRGRARYWRWWWRWWRRKQRR